MLAAVLDPLAELIPGPLEPLLNVKELAREVTLTATTTDCSAQRTRAMCTCVHIMSRSLPRQHTRNRYTVGVKDTTCVHHRRTIIVTCKPVRTRVC